MIFITNFIYRYIELLIRFTQQYIVFIAVYKVFLNPIFMCNALVSFY